MIFIGVDPDTKGAIAVLRSDRSLVDLAPIPTRLLRSGKRQLAVVNATEAHKTAIRIRNLHAVAATEVTVIIETPNRGFNEAQPLGFALKHQNYGTLLGVLAATFGAPFEVSASKWKAFHKLKSDKSKSLELAARLFPSHARVFSLAKHHGYAEASLIAFWGLIEAAKAGRVDPLE